MFLSAEDRRTDASEYPEQERVFWDINESKKRRLLGRSGVKMMTLLIVKNLLAGGFEHHPLREPTPDG